MSETLLVSGAISRLLRDRSQSRSFKILRVRAHELPQAVLRQKCQTTAPMRYSKANDDCFWENLADFEGIAGIYLHKHATFRKFQGAVPLLFFYPSH